MHAGVEPELTRVAAQALAEAGSGGQAGVRTATQTVSQFWRNEIDSGTPAGACWWELLKVAEGAPDPPEPGYAVALDFLHAELARQLRAAP